MKQTLRHTFETDEATYWRDVFFDAAFLERLYKEGLGCTSVIVHEDSGDTPAGRTRRLTFAQPIDAPGPIKKLFGDSTTMEERGRFDPATKRWRFTMVPDRMADKLKISGETWLESRGPGRVERVQELEYHVSIFGIGGLIEKFMASSSEESLEKQARFTRDYLAQKR